MTKERSKQASMVLSTLGILFMLAMAFKILPFNIAIFAGAACFILAGTVSRFGRDQD